MIFIIGMRPNKWWKVHQWLPVALAMPRMIRELTKQPEMGFMGARQSGLWLVQYWRSFDHLVAYARSRDNEHFPAWVKFNKRVGSSGDVGIWHETYLVRAGEYETLYHNMPQSGMGKFGELVPATGRYGSASSRAGKIERDDAPVTPEGDLRVH